MKSFPYRGVERRKGERRAFYTPGAPFYTPGVSYMQLFKLVLPEDLQTGELNERRNSPGRRKTDRH